MSPILMVVIVVLSLALSTFFVVRDARSFAVAPPTPLIDLDRFFDTIYNRLDEKTGSQLTPKELAVIVDSFVSSLGSHGLIRENLAETSQEQTQSDTLNAEQIIKEIYSANPQLDVPDQAVSEVVSLSFGYLREINALI